MTQATFTITEGTPPKPARGGKRLTLQLNPASLKLTVTNTMQDEQADAQKSAKKKDSRAPPRQNVRKSATKLETELVFDSTDTGEDVRTESRKLKDMARPNSGKDQALPQVTLEWGLFSFTGVIESITETLDFWSGEGVPLRSTMQIVMQSLELDVLKDAPKQQTNTAAPKDGLGTTGLATPGGESGGGRAIAAANGLESMRMPDGGVVSVADDVELIPAAAFSASGGAGLDAAFGAGAAAGFAAGAGFSAGAGAGFSAGAAAGFGGGASLGFGGGAAAGFSAGAAAGFGASASASFGAAASASFGAAATSSAGVGFGASASAGITATGGAFAGLGRSKRVAVGLRLEPERLLPLPATRAIGTGASFDVTGRVVATGSAGLSAGAQGGARVRFM